jgi:hypothetical protein
MSRGGHRDNAGRKSSWDSGAKFEDTIPVRVPKNIKDQILAIAHQIDAGETFDIETKSNTGVIEQQLKIEQLEQDNQNLHQVIESQRLDFNVQLKLLQDKILILEQEKQQITKDLEITKLELVTKSNELISQIELMQERTKSKRDKLVTKSEKITQTEIFDINSNLLPLDEVSLAKRYGVLSIHLKDARKKGNNKYIPPTSSKDFGVLEWDFCDEDNKYHPILLKFS